ncbi:MAG: PD-(D/E)XK nuclease family protein [Flavobacteriales bacterium]|nr:PD-(D/E)XK nuclease family protein [Flavobacteriales bacterium]
MRTFLDDIASELLKQGGNDFSQTCIVLPNRRAGVFLRNAISKESKKAIWAPTILSIEDFVFSLSSLVKADQTTLLFAFYEVYKQRASDPQTIELFASWAPIFLSDINELDLNLIDAEDIFAQLYSIERIKKWNPDKAEATEFQKKHLHFVEQFYPFYQQLRNALKSKGVAYQGMAFREVAEHIDSIVSQSEWDRVWFAGFNALTVSEERILAGWQNSGKARLFWDMDAFYADDTIHEAGHYIRRYNGGTAELKLPAEYNWKACRLGVEPKEINLIAAQRNMTQAAIASTILEQRLDKGNEAFSGTAVVLNDEQLLVPLLSSLPTHLNGVNITMGYGLRQSQSAVFVEHLFKLYSRYAESGGRYYHEHVAALENDPFFQLVQTEFIKEERAKQVYFSAPQLQQSELHQLVFNDTWSSVTGFLEELKRVFSVVGKRLDEDSIEREFLFLLDKLAQRLLDLNSEFSSIDSIKTLHTFWKQLLRSQQLDFVGEPLTGLQIMGMLETRNLDFEEIIMLGVNEGNLPSNAHSPSYFTFDIRRAYGLACQNERDAVTAYHFYRLLQRAKRIHLIYDQDTDSLGRGEVSRYVKQLMLEGGQNLAVKEWSVEQEIPESVAAPPITIQKGDDELQKLKERAEFGFSPSALNTFRSCSLKYYFRYVAGIREPDEFQEDMDAVKLGLAIHKTLEDLYQPFVGRTLVADELKKKKGLFRDILLKRFKEQLETKEDLSGPDLLTFEAAATYVDRVITHDLDQVNSGQVITVLQLEGELQRDLQLLVEKGKLSVRLKGNADRLDRLSDGTLRVIDYKTGGFNKTLKITDKAAFGDPKSDNAFQMLTYLYMASVQYDADSISPMGFYLRSTQVEKAVSVFEDKMELKGSELTRYAEELIVETLTELFDASIPFSQTEDVKRCEHCEFNAVCQRG